MALVPADVVTVTSTVAAACAGVTASIVKKSTCVKLAAGTFPKSTAVAPMNWQPETMTLVPPPSGPAGGWTPMTCGGEEPTGPVQLADTRGAEIGATARLVPMSKATRPSRARLNSIPLPFRNVLDNGHQASRIQPSATHSAGRGPKPGKSGYRLGRRRKRSRRSRRSRSCLRSLEPCGGAGVDRVLVRHREDETDAAHETEAADDA